MPNPLANLLRDYIGKIDSLYLFTGQNGTIMSDATYKRFWNGIYNKINNALGGTNKVMEHNKVINPGIRATNLTPHTFRYNYATTLYYCGIDVKEAQRLLGHSSIKVTLEIYTHLMDDKKDLNDKINTAMAF